MYGAYLLRKKKSVKIKVMAYEAKGGGFWAEVPVIPRCATQGETIDELLANLREAIEGCLAVDVAPMTTASKQCIFGVTV